MWWTAGRVLARGAEMEQTLWLESLLRSLCDGEWEHGNGIRIETLDNPGWAISIEVEGTDLECHAFESISLRRTEDDWMDCHLEGTVLQAFCGPGNLKEAIDTLRRWVEDVRR